MSRVENNRKKKKYIFIISGLLFIIVGLLIFIVVDSYSDRVKEEGVEGIKDSTSSYEVTNSSSFSVSQSSNEITMSSSTSNNENNYASEAVKKLSIEQRAALIILGAPDDWLFNGYPSQSTRNESVRQIAESDSNIIKLMKVNQKLADNTSEEDQMFFVTGKDIRGGIGGIPTLTYAFGREDNKIYYYVANTGVYSKPDAEIATNLGEANIDDIWLAYYNVGDMSTVNKIANNIIIE